MKKQIRSRHHLLTEIASHIRKLRSRERKWRSENDYIKRTQSRVEEKLAEWVNQGKHREHNPSIQHIVEELDITRDELAFYCATKLHKTFYTWRKELRIREAQEIILEHPDMSFSQIAFSVGIPDKSDFRHQFKSVVGCTPGEWRRSNGHPKPPEAVLR